MIPHIKAIVEAARERGLVAAGFIQRQLITESLATKHGLFAYQRYADSRLSTTVRRADGSSSGWASQASVRLGELDGAAAARIAVDKCVRWNKPAKVEPGKYTVVLEPAAVAALVPLMSNSLSARVTEQGRSFLSRKGGGTLLGEKLFPEFITLHSDPLNPAFPVLVWGVDGLPLRRVTWIEKGVVKNLAYDRYWASKADVPPTPTTAAPAGFPRTASDFVLEGSDRSLDQLIKSVDRGLLVTRFWYVRALNPQTVQLTGLTRDGLFLIEKGQVSAPVMNLRFNESPVRLLQNARMLGQALRTTAERGRCIAPAMVAADFNFSSISDAV
jgi:predicted Zn-dependent protease